MSWGSLAVPGATVVKDLEHTCFHLPLVRAHYYCGELKLLSLN
jgi:hypothetical protein